MLKKHIDKIAEKLGYEVKVEKIECDSCSENTKAFELFWCNTSQIKICKKCIQQFLKNKNQNPDSELSDITRFELIDHSGSSDTNANYGRQKVLYSGKYNIDCLLQDNKRTLKVVYSKKESKNV